MNLELNMPHNFVYKKGFSSEGALRSGTEKSPGRGRQPGKRKEADAAEGQSERSNEARPEPRKARRQVRMESCRAARMKKKATPPKKRGMA